MSVIFRKAKNQGRIGLLIVPIAELPSYGLTLSIEVCYNTTLEMCLRLLRVLLVWVAGCALASGSPAPAPVLQSPGVGATNVDPDPTLAWQWTDDLISNGSFESALTPAWYFGGPNPTIWQVYVDTTNRYGMGYRWMTTYMPSLSRATGQLIQDISVPADATSATLQWSERIWNLLPGPGPSIGKLSVWLSQGGVRLATLENSTGSELIFLSHTWVQRSTNLLAFAGQSFQLIFQADSYSPNAANSWYADVDGVSFSCAHATGTPEFQVFVSQNPVLRSSDQVGDTTGLTFASIPLASSNVYYWRVGAVRDGITNYSSSRWFRTGQRALPAVAVTGQTAAGVRLSFPTHTSRYYTVEQTDSLDATAPWYDVFSAGLGTGAPMEVEVPLPYSDTAFWRLRISP